MTLMILPYLCFLFSTLGGANFTCVGTTERATAILEKGGVKEVLWAPWAFEDTQSFLQYMKENHPSVKIEDIQLWTPGHDSCDWWLR